MSSFVGVIVELGSNPLDDVLSCVGAERTTNASQSSHQLILLPWSKDALERTRSVAQNVSQKAASAFAILAETLTDIYSIAHCRAGVCTRQFSFERDAEENRQWELEGEAETWEAELLFALPEDDFVGYLSHDDTYTDADLERARAAHAAKDLTLVARRPPLLAASVWEWLGRLGLDPRSPQAQIKLPKFWKRLFGR
jgi:hypothetical protein